MEGPVQDTRRDRSNELRIEAVSWNRKTPGAPLGKSMLCRSLQIDGLQHQEMGTGLSGLKKAAARLYDVYLRPSEAIRPDTRPHFSEEPLLASVYGLDGVMVQKRPLLLRDQFLGSVP